MLERIIYLIIVIGILVMESDVVVQIYKGMKNSFSIKRDLRLVSKQINKKRRWQGIQTSYASYFCI